MILQLRMLLGLSLFLTSSLSVAKPASTLLERLQGPKVGAHQGGVFHFLPNTLKGFKKAVSAGVDIVEMDLRASKEGVVFVFHDESLSTWTWCKGKIADQPFQKIKKCSYKFNAEKIPTFEEVLQWSVGKVVINADFKDTSVIAEVVRLVKKYDAYEWAYFQSNSDPNLYEKVRELDRRLPLLFAPSDPTELIWILGLNDPHLLVIEVHESIRDSQYIQAIHDAGKVASENSWQGTWNQEIFGAKCTLVFEQNLDIAISNRLKHCVKQRDRFQAQSEILK